MKKILKYIIIVILAIIAVLIIHLIRNFYIINSLKAKFDLLYRESNYHIQQRTSQASSYIIFDMFKTSENSKLVEHRFSLEDYSNMTSTSFFSDEVITYIDTNENKYTNTNSNVQEIKIVNPYNLYSKNSQSNILVELMKTKISSIQYADTNCYLITNSMVSNMYIDKSTGLVLKQYNGTSTQNNISCPIETTYFYEFNTVTQQDVLDTNIE